MGVIDAMKEECFCLACASHTAKKNRVTRYLTRDHAVRKWNDDDFRIIFHLKVDHKI